MEGGFSGSRAEGDLAGYSEQTKIPIMAMLTKCSSELKYGCSTTLPRVSLTCHVVNHITRACDASEEGRDLRCLPRGGLPSWKIAPIRFAPLGWLGRISNA